MASVLADTHKVSAPTIQRILRHKKLATTERYIQKISSDVRATLELLEIEPEVKPRVENAPDQRTKEKSGGD